MIRSGNGNLRSLLPGLYPVAVLIAVVPFIELVGETGPVRPTAATWRLSFIGQSFGLLGTPILGLALAMVVAAALGQRRVLRSASCVAIASAIALMLAMTRFLLDFGQLQAIVPVADRAGFDAAAFRALIFAALVVPVLIVLGGRGWISSRRPPPPSLQRSEAQAAARVIPFPGRPSSPDARWPHR